MTVLPMLNMSSHPRPSSITCPVLLRVYHNHQCVFIARKAAGLCPVPDYCSNVLKGGDCSHSRDTVGVTLTTLGPVKIQININLYSRVWSVWIVWRDSVTVMA